MNIKPWGLIDWLLPKTGINDWHIITSSSFEDRCLSLTEWLRASQHNIRSSTLFRITNPSSPLWDKCVIDIEKNSTKLAEWLAAENKIIEISLLDQVGNKLSANALNYDEYESVILDITTLPKRFFLFALKQLVNSNFVKNLVITYGNAASYPELALCENALPPTALTGFGRVNQAKANPRMIVGVGYMPLSVEDLLEKAKNAKLDFIFPFPPASPAFRRNWELLSMLMPHDIPRNTEIHRINGMDAFAAYEKILSWGKNTDLDFLPLGPKPHSLGMAMAYMRLEGRAEVIYSQPQAYNHDYSVGILRNKEGLPQINAYCLKINGRVLF